jgi:hypothetical protein
VFLHVLLLLAWTSNTPAGRQLTGADAAAMIALYGTWGKYRALANLCHRKPMGPTLNAIFLTHAAHDAGAARRSFTASRAPGLAVRYDQMTYARVQHAPQSEHAWCSWALLPRAGKLVVKAMSGRRSERPSRCP